MSNRIVNWVLPVTLIAFGLLVWEITVRVRDTPQWMLPRPSAIGNSLWNDRSLLWQHTWVTFQEVMLGFTFALVFGVLIGGLIASSRILQRALYPLIIASQTIPMVALAPILIVWYGYGLTPKVIVTALVCFFPIAVSTVDGLAGADREILAMLKSFGASSWKRFWMARVPAALPSLFSGIRVAITFSVIGAVFGELVGASEGLGYLMQRAAPQFQTARVFAALVVLSAMGIGLFVLATLVERRVIPWRRVVTESADAE